jgi:hypothetical protein
VNRKTGVLIILLLVFAWSSAFARLPLNWIPERQEQTALDLRLKRNFGYSSGSGHIQGSFTLAATPAGAPTSSPQLSRVIFTIDGETMGEATQPPYELRFSTDNYPLGKHTLAAVGITASGEKLNSNQIVVVFATAEEGMQAGIRIVIPLIGFIFLLMLASLGLSFLGARKVKHLPPGTPRKYGFSGGAICPNCDRPYPLGFLSFNLGPGRKFDRCPFCGKWSIMKVKTMAVLRAAEAAELTAAQNAMMAPVEEEERMRKELDESKYLNM